MSVIALLNVTLISVVAGSTLSVPASGTVFTTTGGASSSLVSAATTATAGAGVASGMAAVVGAGFGAGGSARSSPPASTTDAASPRATGTNFSCGANMVRSTP